MGLDETGNDVQSILRRLVAGDEFAVKWLLDLIEKEIARVQRIRDKRRVWDRSSFGSLVARIIKRAQQEKIRAETLPQFVVYLRETYRNLQIAKWMKRTMPDVAAEIIKEPTEGIDGVVSMTHSRIPREMHTDDGQLDDTILDCPVDEAMHNEITEAFREFLRHHAERHKRELETALVEGRLLPEKRKATLDIAIALPQVFDEYDRGKKIPEISISLELKPDSVNHALKRVAQEFQESWLRGAQ